MKVAVKLCEVNLIWLSSQAISLWEEHQGEWDYIKPFEINGDGNPTFMIGDPMKNVHMGNNKSLVNSTSSDYFVHSYGVLSARLHQCEDKHKCF